MLVLIIWEGGKNNMTHFTRSYLIDNTICGRFDPQLTAAL